MYFIYSIEKMVIMWAKRNRSNNTGRYDTMASAEPCAQVSIQEGPEVWLGQETNTCSQFQTVNKATSPALSVYVSLF